MQNNDISKIMIMVRPDVSPAAYSLLQHSQLTTASVEKKLFHAAKTATQVLKPKIKNVKQYMTLHFDSCT